MPGGREKWYCTDSREGSDETYRGKRVCRLHLLPLRKEKIARCVWAANSDIGITLLLAATASRAQMAPDNVGSSANGHATILQGVGFRPELNAQMPLDTPFKDEAGKDVRLANISISRSRSLCVVYYGCPMMCTSSNKACRRAAHCFLQSRRDYEVVSSVLTSREPTAQMAAEKKSHPAMSKFRRLETATLHSSLVRNNPSPLPRMRQISFQF